MPSPAVAMDSTADKLDTGIRSGLLRDVHAVVVSRDGQIVLERYYPGNDDAWGKPLGVVNFGPEARAICAW